MALITEWRLHRKESVKVKLEERSIEIIKINNKKILEKNVQIRLG